MRPILWTSKPLARALREQLSTDTVVVGSIREFVDAPRDTKTVSFVDGENLAALDRLANDLAAPNDQPTPPELRRLMIAVDKGPIVGVSTEAIARSLDWMPTHPWLSHVLSAALIETDLGKHHLENLMATFKSSSEPRLLDWLRPAGSGRRVRLTHASRRAERIERMSQFFQSHGIPATTINTTCAVADVLLTNAFYDAPVEAGAQKQTIDRTLDVALPDEFACDFAYGARDNLAIIRVRDPFGALKRPKLLDARTKTVPTGLGKVFAAASILGVSVIANVHTEVLVGVADGQPPEHQALAVHLFFRAGTRRGFWKTMDDEDTGIPSLSKSVTVTMIPE